MDISKVQVSGTEYTLKDPVARGEEEETEGISHISVGGEIYDCKDIVARGEGSATATEISKVEVGGKVYQIKDEEARAKKVYFAVYSTDDDSLTFYGDTEKPTVGSQYKDKTVSGVYDFEDTPQDDYPEFNDDWYADMKSVYADPSASGARPKSCCYWFDYCQNLESVDLSNLNTSSVTTMESMFSDCSSLTNLDMSGFDTSSVTTMGDMFQGCTSLTTIYSDDNVFVTTAVTNGDGMFNNCTNLVGGNGTAYDSSRITHTMAHVDRPDNEGYFTDVNDK